MTERRSYRQYCGLAKALDVVGERWTLLVVRNLLLGPLRYSDLLRGLPGITTNLLAKRLRDMARAGLVEPMAAVPGATGSAYRLTRVGYALEPAIHALGSWGWQRMGRPRRHDHRSLEWLLVALRRRYRGGLSLGVELVADEVPYALLASGDELTISRGPLPNATLRVAGRSLDLARLFLEGDARGLRLDRGSQQLPALLRAFNRGDAQPATADQEAGHRTRPIAGQTRSSRDVRGQQTSKSGGTP
ncbi:MAG: helix-turn-helix domain-containing protein [Vicinamibacterales bacterium]